ncbi:MAG: hypothetical protein KGD63_04535 [Candidatus Lokiarchaeota archaeon]|nr:hypothetical protein [Candidatus Lokiarchaeota archaeon]
MTNLIIIDITDKENILLDGPQNIKEISGTGKVVVRNPSGSSRLWNLEMNLKETVNTGLEKDVEVGMLNPGQVYEKEYQIQNLKDSVLKLEEIFDSNRDIPNAVNNVLLFNRSNSSKLKILLVNTLDLGISDISYTRELPTFLKNLQINAPNVGKAEIGEEEGKKLLHWNIESLEGKQTAVLEVICDALINEREQQALGKTKVTYIANNHKLTLLTPEIKGLTDSLSGVTTDEGASPGTWECNVEFINESEFQVKVQNVKVSHNISTGEEVIVSETPERILNPDESWDHDFKLDSENVPQLDSSVVFTTLYKVVTRVIGEINKESTIYSVLSAEIEKAILPPEVDAYANTNMTIENTITNKGSSNIDAMVIIDEIPLDFIPPTIKDIKLLLNSNEGPIEIHSREEFVKKFEISPEDVSPDSKHSISIDLNNLEKDFQPNTEIKMSYPLLAKNPKPETQYKTPVEIQINCSIRGEAFVISPEIEPEIKIKYVKRKLKTLKSIKPGINEGEFDITVRIQNKGDVELENVEVKDRIPEGFQLTDFNPKELKYEVIEQGVEKLLDIQIVELSGQEAISIQYSCAGSADYPRTEPKVIVRGRGGVSSKESKLLESGPTPLDTAVSDVGLQKKGQLYDIFLKITQAIEHGTSCNALGDLLEDMRDDIPPGPVLHQLMQFSRDLKTKGDKMIVGNLRDEILTKVKDYQQKYDA